MRLLLFSWFIKFWKLTANVSRPHTVNVLFLRWQWGDCRKIAIWWLWRVKSAMKLQHFTNFVLFDEFCDVHYLKHKSRVACNTLLRRIIGMVSINRCRTLDWFKFLDIQLPSDLRSHQRSASHLQDFGAGKRLKYCRRSVLSTKCLNEVRCTKSLWKNLGFSKLTIFKANGYSDLEVLPYYSSI